MAYDTSRWKTLLARPKIGSNIVNIIQRQPNLEFKFEQSLVKFLKSLSADDQTYVEERALITSGVQPNEMNEKDFAKNKSDSQIESLTLAEQYQYAKNLSNLNDKMKWLTKVAEQGYCDAMTELGLLYMEQNNEVAAIYWWAKASKKGCIRASVNLGFFFHWKNDYKTAAEMFMRAANPNGSIQNGDPRAQKQLGIYYQSGNGVEKDEKAGLKWFLASSQNEKNHEFDPDNEFRWQTLLTRLKTSLKIVNVLKSKPDLNLKFEESLIEFLNGLSQEEQQYIEDRAFVSANIKPNNMNNAVFLNIISEMHYESLSPEIQYEYAKSLPNFYTKMKWLTKAARRGHRDAQTDLGFIYLEQNNHDLAMYWLAKASKQGSTIASYNLGYLLDLKKDYKKAAEYFTRAANPVQSGDPRARAALGIYYSVGRGVEKDEKTAFKWFLAAGEKYNVIGLIELARCYKFGIGTAKNEKLAFETMGKARWTGDPTAKQMYAQWYPNPFTDSKEKEKCVIS